MEYSVINVIIKTVHAVDYWIYIKNIWSTLRKFSQSKRNH